MPRERKVPDRLQAEISPTARGFATITISEDDMNRINKHRGATKDARGRWVGPVSAGEMVGRLLDYFEAPPPAPPEPVPGVPVEALAPVSKALHDLARQISGDQIHSKGDLLKAVRAIRDLLDELLSR